MMTVIKVGEDFKNGEFKVILGFLLVFYLQVLIEKIVVHDDDSGGSCYVLMMMMMMEVKMTMMMTMISRWSS